MTDASLPGGPPGVCRRVLMKIGGELAADPAVLDHVLGDVRRLLDRGVEVAVVHGGGPQISAAMAQQGLAPTMVQGQRVTDAASLVVVQQVLAGEVSSRLVAAAVQRRVRAVGLSGAADGLVSATRRPPRLVRESGEPRTVDYGLVGDVVDVRPEVVEVLCRAGFVPIIAPLGIEPGTGQLFNVNADTVAAAIAAAWGADVLLLVTNVPGVLKDREDPASRFPALNREQVRQAVEGGIITGGMVPKVEEALAALDRGVPAVTILPPEPGALVAALYSSGAVGTTFLP
jgi:acetylglutamate kinase